MLIEVLYFDGCPGHSRVLPTVRRLAARVGADVALRRVETAEDAVASRFLGSPTVRVDGRDVEHGAETRSDYGLKCRLYKTSDGLAGLPVEAWIESALADAPAAHGERRRGARGSWRRAGIAESVGSEPPCRPAAR